LLLCSPLELRVSYRSIYNTTTSWGDLPIEEQEWSDNQPYVLDCTAPTYQSRGVSPVPDSTLPTKGELWTRIQAYERELQTLHAVEQCPDMRQFIDDILRENPTIFTNPKFTSLTHANLIEDPQQEIITAILASAALCPKPMTPSPSTPASPAPLMVPPPSHDTAPPSTDNEEEGPESCSTTPSPVLSTHSREQTEFLSALSSAPKGVAPNAALDEVGWHTALGGCWVEIPTMRHQWGTAPATFLHYYLHPASAEPMVDTAEGEDTGVYGDTLKAVPQPNIESTTCLEDINDVLGGQHYFHGATQRALWNLGDYSVIADAWHLYNGPSYYAALAEQEAWVLHLEAMARLEHQGFQRERTNLLWGLSTTRQRLHEARVLEHLHPYLKHDGSGKEQQILPACTRGAQANLLEAQCDQRANTCALTANNKAIIATPVNTHISTARESMLAFVKSPPLIATLMTSPRIVLYKPRRPMWSWPSMRKHLVP
jgi:hypothetical protein